MNERMMANNAWDIKMNAASKKRHLWFVYKVLFYEIQPLMRENRDEEWEMRQRKRENGSRSETVTIETLNRTIRYSIWRINIDGQLRASTTTAT